MSKNCAGCKFFNRCTSAQNGRTIERYEVDELKEAMAKVFENEGARKIYGQRNAMVEPVFSELRGLQKLNCLALLQSVWINATRLKAKGLRFKEEKETRYFLEIVSSPISRK